MAKTVKQELEELGKAIVVDAKATVPVDTGALKNSLKYEYTFISNDQFNITIFEKYYGTYVNKGTSRQKAQPYLDNAVKKNLPKGIDDIINIISGEILHKIIEKK